MAGQNSLCLYIFTLLLVAVYIVSCTDNKSTGSSGGFQTGDSTGTVIANHEAVLAFDNIPEAVIDSVVSQLNIYYAHTSHGSQLMTGLDMVESENALYIQPYCYEYSDDLGQNGDTSWIAHMRTYLADHQECNVVMLSWCGGVSDNTEAGINIYLNAMSGLETDYPQITFVYMTGHLDGTGEAGNLRIRNDQIRDYCQQNGKILYDFADIESYDPNGTFYPDDTDACNWCTDWCMAYQCPDCYSCAHSHCFNCYLKGKAFWWMMARLVGWDN